MSSKSIDTFKKVITSKGYRVTQARINTFKLLVGPEPQSMSDVLVKAEDTVDRVSVYRNVDLFEKLGIINRIHIGWKYKLELSDEFMPHHHHMSCLSCEKTIDIEDEKHIDEFIAKVADAAGFTPRRHVFEVDGYCSDCSAQRYVS